MINNNSFTTNTPATDLSDHNKKEPLTYLQWRDRLHKNAARICLACDDPRKTDTLLHAEDPFTRSCKCLRIEDLIYKTSTAK